MQQNQKSKRRTVGLVAFTSVIVMSIAAIIASATGAGALVASILAPVIVLALGVTLVASTSYELKLNDVPLTMGYAVKRA